MGFLGNILTATIKVALTPVAIVKDAANIAFGNEADATKKLPVIVADKKQYNTKKRG